MTIPDEQIIQTDSIRLEIGEALCGFRMHGFAFENPEQMGKTVDATGFDRRASSYLANAAD